MGWGVRYSRDKEAVSNTLMHLTNSSIHNEQSSNAASG